MTFIDRRARAMVCAVAFSFGAAASQVEPAPLHAPTSESIAPPKMLDTVVVSGIQPGPGMWYVTKGEHELWILGALGALPAKMEWDASELIEVLSGTQEIIWPPNYIVDMEAGFFNKMYLGYRYLKAQNNPDGKTLEEVLPADVYARWAVAKARYLRGNRGVERKRPLVAADDLYKAALEHNGLVSRPVIQPKIKATLEKYSVAATVPKVTVVIEDPKAALRMAQDQVLNDTACMAATLDAIEQDMPRMVTNANAWASGDVVRISFERISRRERACADAFSNNELSRKLGIPDVQASMKGAVMSTLERALEVNRTTVAVLPLQDVMGDAGFVQALRARGYGVVSPSHSKER